MLLMTAADPDGSVYCLLVDCEAVPQVATESKVKPASPDRALAVIVSFHLS